MMYLLRGTKTVEPQCGGTCHGRILTLPRRRSVRKNGIEHSQATFDFHALRTRDRPRSGGQCQDARLSRRRETAQGRNRVAVGDHLRIVTQGSSVGWGTSQPRALGRNPVGIREGRSVPDVLIVPFDGCRFANPKGIVTSSPRLRGPLAWFRPRYLGERFLIFAYLFRTRAAYISRSASPFSRRAPPFAFHASSFRHQFE